MENSVMTVHDIIAATTQKLESAGIPSARLDAEVLLAFCLKCDRMDFMKNPQFIPEGKALAVFHQLIERRLRFEPVAYLTGRKDFWTFTLEVNPDVLIPRPDTEVIVEEALDVCRAGNWTAPRILDIGTGSGAIALTLAAEIPGALITATDLSQAALHTARKNARRLALADRITFLAGDLFEPVRGIFDIIVSNPPYIGAEEYETLPAGVRDYEPMMALRAGETGLEFYEKLIYQAYHYLVQKGWLLLEIGAKQGETASALMAQTGFYEHLNVRADYAGLPRVLKGRRKTSG